MLAVFPTDRCEGDLVPFGAVNLNGGAGWGSDCLCAHGFVSGANGSGVDHTTRPAKMSPRVAKTQPELAIVRLMDDLASLREAERCLQKAQLESDIAALDTLLHPKVSYVGPDGTVMDKEADLDSHRSVKLRIDTLEQEDIDVRVLDGTGVTIVAVRLSGEMAGQSFNVRMRYTRAWTCGEWGWRVVVAHASLMPN